VHAVSARLIEPRIIRAGDAASALDPFWRRRRGVPG
jgi:hypothetical protein